MKTFIFSIITFFVILLSVSSYIHFLYSSTKSYTNQLNEIIEIATNEDWNSCQKNYDTFRKKWENDKNWYEAFISHLDTEQISDIVTDLNFHILYKDKKNVLMYCTKLKNIFNRIYDDEIPTPQNIV